MEAEQFARFHYRGRDIPALLQQWAEQRGDAIFLQWHPFYSEPRQWTYAEFWRDVQALAAGLSRRGLKRGDRLLIHSKNCPEMLLAWYACATLGAIAVTTNTGATPAEFRHFVDNAEPVAAVTQPAFAQLVRENAPQLQWVAVTNDNAGKTAASHCSTQDFIAFDALPIADGQVPTREPEPLLPAGIMYTSGTTGLPKAVVHSHANFLWAGEIGPANIDFRPDDVMLAHFPLFHTNAQLWSVAVALGVGGRCVLVPRVSVSRFWDIVTRYDVTHCSVMSLLLEGLAQYPVPAQHRLREVNMGFVNRELERRWGVRCPGMWGMSETVIHTLHSSLRRQWPAFTLGRPTPGYEIRLVDPESGNDCAAGQAGELWVRGTRGVQLFLGYFNDSEATAKSFSADGWFRTGDRALLDDDGNYYFQDRLKDVLKVGGENVSASEIEARIMQLPEIREVAVVAQQDAALDEVPVAFVILCEGVVSEVALAERIIQHCAAHLSKFKVPRAVWFEAEFPRALLGKVAKNRLRELADARRSNLC